MGPIAAGDEFEAIDRIFSEALDLPESERSAFVTARCPSQPALLNSVMKLLTQFEKLGSFLEKPAFSTPSDREWLAGRVISGRFRIVEKLGSGGMGEVYRAYDLKLGDTVALKRIRADLKNDRETLLRFHAEIKLARKVSHPNVCRLFDLFTEDLDGEETVFVTMEYLDGDTLCQRLGEARPPDSKEILQIVRDIAEGLGAAHAQGIVHRDLKPSNILLARSGTGATRAVITDFGLAHPLEASLASPNTRSGFIAGSPPYMAPEQFLGSEITPAADIYALSVIVFEMASGRRPFPDESIIRMAIRRTTKDPPSLRDFAPVAPAAWERAIQQGLSRNPIQRQRSAREFTEQMEGRRRAAFIPHVSRRSFVSAGAVAGILAAFYGIWRYSDQGPLLTEIKRPVLMMLAPLTQSDVRNPTAAASFALLLERQLGQSDRVQLLSVDRIERAWRRNPNNRGALPALFAPRAAREVALREHVDCVLFGGISQVAEEWTLRLRLELIGNSPEHARLWRTRDFHQQDPASAAYEASTWIRRTLAESSADLEKRSRRPEELTTSSWHALEEYVLGNEAWRLGDRPAAIEHLREALHIDTEFALASARLADMLTATGLTDEGLPYYEQAERLLISRDLTDRESLRMRGIFALDTGRYEEAEHVLILWAQAFPDDALPLYYRSIVLDRLGRPEEAGRLLDEAIRLDPNSYSFQFRHAHRALLQGSLDRAEALLPAAERLAANDWADQLRAAIALGRLDFAGCWAHLAHMQSSGSVPFQSRAFVLKACFRSEEGRFEEAAQLLEDGLRYDREHGLPLDGQCAKIRRRAQIRLNAGDRSGAVDYCRAALAPKPGRETTMQIGCVLARAGDIRAAEKLLGKSEPRWPVQIHWFQRLRGEIALARGDARRALALIRDAPPPRSEEWPLHLVRAAVSAGDPELADHWLDQLFSNPAKYWYDAESTEPGFFRTALGLAKEVRYHPTQPEALQARNGLENHFTRR